MEEFVNDGPFKPANSKERDTILANQHKYILDNPTATPEDIKEFTKEVVKKMRGS